MRFRASLQAFIVLKELNYASLSESDAGLRIDSESGLLSADGADGSEAAGVSVSEADGVSEFFCDFFSSG